MIPIQEYQTLVFDCDGVLFDSNRVKTEAFRVVASQFGMDAANNLVTYHTQNGGISRYRKFEYLLTQILHRDAPPELVNQLSKQYGDCVEQDLLNCAVAPGLETLREKTRHAKWMIVSGGDQAQLRRVFADRELDHLFDGGIFGSPTSKDEILLREIANGAIQSRALYAGDSRFDHMAALRARMDFVFIHGWSEFADWQTYSKEHGIRCVATLSDLLALFDQTADLSLERK